MAIPTLLTSLQHGEFQLAEKILEKIKVETLPERTSRQLLVKCLEACERCGEPQGATLVRSFWEDEDVDDPRFTLPLSAKLFTYAELSDEVLAFALPPDATPQELLRAFTSWESKTIVPFACQRVVDLMGKLTTEEYKELVELSEAEGNQQALDFFQDKYEASLPPAPKPEWVRDFDLMVLQDSEEELELPECHQVLDAVCQEEERAHLEALVLLSSATARKVLLGLPVSDEERAKDLELFRKYGPACGGERMLSSEGVIQDHDDLDSTTASGWFTGSCDECGKKIQGKECAIRQPREGGDWRGCFCSLECLKAVDDSPRIDILSIQLKAFGIQERTPTVKLFDFGLSR